jgi:chemotaxis response regulator CheB
MEPAAEKSCRVVGIGASAGGQDALKEFFTAAPPDCAHAFVEAKVKARTRRVSAPKEKEKVR